MIEVLSRGSGKVFGMKVSGKLLHQDYQQFDLCSPIRWRGTVRMDMPGLHIGFWTRPQPVRTEPDQQGRKSSTPKASFFRLDRILFMSEW